MSRSQFIASKKERVRGTGPARDRLPNFYKIMNVEKELMNEIVKIVDSNLETNDIYGSDYSVSKYCDLRAMLPREHVNILLQKPTEGSDGMNQKEYTNLTQYGENPVIKNFLNSEFPGCYRARIAVLAPKSSIDWHIDMNTRVSCRFHLLIENKDINFEVNRKGDIASIPFEEGSLFFTNTAYPHKVTNNSDKRRISLLLDIDYENIADKLPLLEDQ